MLWAAYESRAKTFDDEATKIDPATDGARKLMFQMSLFRTVLGLHDGRGYSDEEEKYRQRLLTQTRIDFLAMVGSTKALGPIQ